MNDFDHLISGAVGARADGAPGERPDFGDVLADRQQRLRRRSVVGAVGVLAIGVTGMAAFAVGGPTESTADGPDGPPSSEGPFAATTMPGLVVTTLPGATVWYCEGALDQSIAFPTATTVAPPTTTIAPPTTVALAAPVDEAVEAAPEATYVLPIEDSGYFSECYLIQGAGSEVAPVDEDVTSGTYVPEATPTTTSLVGGGFVAGTVPIATGQYVVQSGDSPNLVAEKFEVPLEDLIAFNGWESGAEFPFPGEEIVIPPIRFYEIKAGDYLIQIANDNCVDLEYILEINGWDSADELGLPGQLISLPVHVNGPCPDNGPTD